MLLKCATSGGITIMIWSGHSQLCEIYWAHTNKRSGPYPSQQALQNSWPQDMSTGSSKTEIEQRQIPHCRDTQKVNPMISTVKSSLHNKNLFTTTLTVFHIICIKSHLSGCDTCSGSSKSVHGYGNFQVRVSTVQRLNMSTTPAWT